MFSRRTLFVLGAGASAEVSFPIGLGLAEDIHKRLQFSENGNGDKDLYNNLIQHIDKRHELLRAAKQIAEGLLTFRSSIDDYLDVHRDDHFLQLIGKAAIIKAILHYERKSPLHTDRSQGFSYLNDQRLKDTWYTALMSMISVSCPDPYKSVENLAFIVFNYDRCLEHFLFKAFQRVYGVPPEQSLEILANCRIYHPYGAVGKLPSVNIDRTRIPFGGSAATGTDYIALSRNIKTYTEQIEDDDLTANLKHEFDAAYCIVFLGFAYHQQNLTLIAPEEPTVRSKDVYGTTYGFSAHNEQIIRSKVMNLTNAHPHFESGLKCFEYLNDYRLGIVGN